METLAALGLATSVVQFVDFASKLLATAESIRSNGVAVDTDRLDKLTKDLLALTLGLRVSEQEHLGDLEAILQGCDEVSKELSEALSRLSHTSSRSKTWNSIVTALKTTMAKDRIDSLTARLSDFREQLNTRLLVMVNTKSKVQASQLSNIQKRLDSPITLVSAFTYSINEEVKDNPTNPTSRSRGTRQEAINAILTREDGTSETISHPSGSTIGARSAHGHSIQRVVTFQSRSSSVTQSTAIPQSQVTSEDYSPLFSTVMSMLSFRMMEDRRENIPKTHGSTFHWLLEESSGDAEWDDLSLWLQHNHGIYWIQGKPGSGKSCLMKFLASDPRTSALLSAWTGGRKCAVASYFFWAFGTPTQNSQEGLLRSLIAQTLQNHPSLLPEVFPQLCREVLSLVSDVASTLSMTELKVAFRKLLSLAATSISPKICFIIDGLDEYTGDHGDFAEFLIDVSKAGNVKMILASRPWNVLADSFGQFPGLRLQDLTRKDIETYVSEKLDDSLGMQSLLKIHTTASQELATRICERASGVFLWVYLAVRSLLRGLSGADELETLRARIDELPTDLESMYRSMFDALSRVQQQKAAQNVLFMLRSTEMQKEEPVTLFQLSLADGITLDEAVAAEVKPVSATQRVGQCDLMRRRLQERTQGLLEVQGRAETGLAGSSAGDLFVGFFHRTTADFFLTREMNDLLKTLAGRSFHPDLLLMGSCLLEAKKLPIEQSVIFASDRVMINARQTLAYASRLEDDHQRPFASVLNSLKETVDHHWRFAKQFKNRSSNKQWESTDGVKWAAEVLLDLRVSDTVIPTLQNLFIDMMPLPMGDIIGDFIYLTLMAYCSLYAADQTLNNDGIGTERNEWVAIWLIVKAVIHPIRGQSASTVCSAVSRILQQDISDYTDSVNVPLHWQALVASLVISPAGSYSEGTSILQIAETVIAHTTGDIKTCLKYGDKKNFDNAQPLEQGLERLVRYCSRNNEKKDPKDAMALEAAYDGVKRAIASRLADAEAKAIKETSLSKKPVEVPPSNPPRTGIEQSSTTKEKKKRKRFLSWLSKGTQKPHVKHTEATHETAGNEHL